MGERKSKWQRHHGYCNPMWSNIQSALLGFFEDVLQSLIREQSQRGRKTERKWANWRKFVVKERALDLQTRSSPSCRAGHLFPLGSGVLSCENRSTLITLKVTFQL